MRSPLVFVVDSLGKDTFGRTRAALMRAGWFARKGYAVYVATWNMKPDYPQVFDRACAALGVSGAVFLNLYQFFSEGDLYAAGESHDSFNTDGEPGPYERFERNRDGGLMKRFVYASDGDTLLKVEAYAPSSNGEDVRPYLVVRYSDKQKIDAALWLRKDGTQKLFSSEHDLFAYWFAAITRKLDGEPVFISEAHDHDNALLSNAYVDHPLTVIASVNSTLYRNPYTYGAKLNGSVSILKRIADYDAVVVPTAAERSDIERIVGHYPRLYAIPYPYEPAESALPDTTRGKKEPIRLVCCFERKSGYRFEDISRVVVQVRQKHADAELDVYGPKSVLKTCKKLFKEADALKNVHLIEERFVPAKSMCRYDAYLSVDAYAAFDLSMVEARYAHVPIISYDYEFGPREIVDDPTVGTLVEYGDVSGMVAAIEKHLPHRGILAKLWPRTVASCERFSPDIVYAQWQSVIEAVSEGRRSPEALLVDAALSSDGDGNIELTAQLAEDGPFRYELSLSDDLASYCDCRWMTGHARIIAPRKAKVIFSITEAADSVQNTADAYMLLVHSDTQTARYRLYLESM